MLSVVASDKYCIQLVKQEADKQTSEHAVCAKSHRGGKLQVNCNNVM